MPPSSQWKDTFLKLLAKMVSRKDSLYFREPVDWEGLGLVDYPTIITQPMDLSTVKSNVEKGLYRNYSEAAEDIRLIFTNAMTYNLPESKVYSHAKSLGEFFETQWATFAKSDEDVRNRPPTMEALSDFVEKCHRITPDELGQVLNKLDILCPNSVVKKPETNEVDINTDLFTGKVFTEINSFIDSLILDMDVFHQKKRAMLQHSSSSSNNIAGHN